MKVVRYEEIVLLPSAVLSGAPSAVLYSPREVRSNFPRLLLGSNWQKDQLWSLLSSTSCLLLGMNTTLMGEEDIVFHSFQHLP